MDSVGRLFEGIWFLSSHSIDIGNSHGKVTSRGYVVLIAIPFKSLRFPARKIQQWGLILYRGITRKNEDSFWPHISYKVQGRLGQAATVYGLEGILPAVTSN